MSRKWTILFITLSGLAAFAATSAREHVAIYDFHVHAPLKGWAIENFFQRDLDLADTGPWVTIERRAGLIISPTHELVGGDEFYQSGRYTDGFDAVVRRIGEGIANFNSQHENSARGVCGIYLGLPNSQE